MKLENKKELASRTLGIGKSRIIFSPSRLSEIKEAITKQDIKDLVSSNAIILKDIKGRKTIERRKTRRRAGSIRKKIKPGKRGYIILTRRFRSYIAQLRRKGEISEELYFKLRQEIRASRYKDLSHLKERLREIKK